MGSMKIRTRFAPSPTGYLHVGSLRTALFAYLFARKNGGEFILRIEDTDRERFVADAEGKILDSLKWAGITPDNATYFISPEEYAQDSQGHYVQSRRLEIYREYVQQLISSGHAYYAFDTPAELTAMRSDQEAAKHPPRYDRDLMKNSLNLSEEETNRLIAAHTPHVVRLRVPEDQDIVFVDAVRGEVQISSSEVDDQVLLKSDGYPTYHLAVVVDDHLMGITHVIRGEEWLPSTPKHLLLYKAFGWEPPQYAHLSLLVNEQKKKLSKREGDVAVEDFRAKGYLPEALINFIAFLGWNPGDEREIFTLPELEQEFSFEQVNKSPAVFDMNKLNHINAQYLKKLSYEEFTARATGQGIALPDFAPELLAKIFVIARDRLVTLADLSSDEYCYVQQLDSYPAQLLVFGKSSPTDTKKGLTKAIELLENSEAVAWDSIESLSTILVQAVAETELKNGDVFWPVRVALSGRDKSPSPAELLWLLGSDESLMRLKAALSLL